MPKKIPRKKSTNLRRGAVMERLRTGLGSGLDWPIGCSSRAQESALRRGIHALEKNRPVLSEKCSRSALPEQPFDDWLLFLSPLFARSRKLYSEGGGKFVATLVTSPRTLSSPILLEQCIEYSPIERELIWAATDALQRREQGYLLSIRTFSSSLFHEQNHRLLWKLLPPPPSDDKGGALGRFQNFAESLVIATDMALGDQLGERIAPFFYLAGVTYDPGSAVGSLGLSRRMYRNYLQANVLATYLTLEMYSEEYVERVVTAHFPMLGDLARRAASRSGRLDAQFITTTNQTWQKRYSKLLARSLNRGRREEALVLPSDPTDTRLLYLFAEKWFEKIGL